jgi:hypothetical protein
MKLVTTLILAATLTSCASVGTTHYGQFDGSRAKASHMDEYEVTVVAIDGMMQFDGASIVNLKPGPHLLQVASKKKGRRGEVYFQALPLRVEPCMRYSYVARHPKSLKADSWELVAKDASPIAGCLPASSASAPANS